MVLKNLRVTMMDNRLKLPIGDKLYAVPEPSAETWLWLKAVYDATPKAVAEGEEPADISPGDAKILETPEIEMHKRALGRVYQEMIDDKVTFAELRVAGQTATVDVMYGRALAEAFFEAGGDWGKLLPPAGDNEQTDTAAPADQPTPTPESSNGATAKTTPGRRGKTSSNTGN